MGKKIYRFNSRFYFIIITVIIVALGVIFKEKIIDLREQLKNNRLLFSCEGLNVNNSSKERYIIFTDKAGYAVYTGRFVLKMSGNIYFNKTKNFKELLQTKNYSEIANFYNYGAVEKIKEYYVCEKVDKTIEYEAVPIPTIKVAGKDYVDSKKLSEIFENLYYKIKISNIKNSKIITVDTYNAANNENGFGKFVENLSSKGYRVTSSNFGETSDGNKIYNNGVSEDDALKFIMNSQQKYIKIVTEPPIASSADIVFLAGNDVAGDLKIVINGNKKKVDDIIKSLEKSGYTNIVKESEELPKDSFIKCNSEDYYTAYKISKLLKIKDIFEEESISNRIEIYIKGDK